MPKLLQGDQLEQKRGNSASMFRASHARKVHPGERLALPIMNCKDA